MAWSHLIKCSATPGTKNDSPLAEVDAMVQPFGAPTSPRDPHARTHPSSTGRKEGHEVEEVQSGLRCTLMTTRLQTTRSSAAKTCTSFGVQDTGQTTRSSRVYARV